MLYEGERRSYIIYLLNVTSIGLCVDWWGFLFTQNRIEKEKHMKKLCIPLLFTIFFYTTFVFAQSDSDTDPNRWERVKSWTGTFTLSCTAQDNVTKTLPDGTILTSIVIDDVNGDCTLNQHVTPPSGAYGWEGNGMGSGTISDFLETKDSTSDCSVETKTAGGVLHP